MNGFFSTSGIAPFALLLALTGCEGEGGGAAKHGAAPAASTEPSGEARWLTSFEDAAAEAERRGVPVLANFTGSDWCIWCKRLDGEVFSTDEFRRWAAENVVLLKLDFPRQKKLPADEAEANAALAKRYGIRGYPTVLFLDAVGTQLGNLGYEPGGPDAWIALADDIVG